MLALAVQARIGIGSAGMGVAASRSALPVGLCVAPTAGGRLIVRSVLGPKALLAGPSLNQRAVDREMFLRQQVALVGQGHHFGKERLDHCVRKQAVAVLGEGLE